MASGDANKAGLNTGGLPGLPTSQKDSYSLQLQPNHVDGLKGNLSPLTLIQALPRSGNTPVVYSTPIISQLRHERGIIASKISALSAEMRALDAKIDALCNSLAPPASPAGNKVDDSQLSPMDTASDGAAFLPSQQSIAHSQQASQASTKTKPTVKRVRIDPETLSSSSSEEDEDEKEPGRPPPICIKNKELWPSLQEFLADEDIKYRRAISITDCIRVYPQTVDDFRLLTRKLDTDKIQYTTHQVRKDKDLVVVIRNVLESLSEDHIKQELEKKKLPIKSVYRMRSRTKLWPLVMVHLDAKSPSARSIFDVKTLCGLDVKVERKHLSSQAPQCKRCMEFRHTANYCKANWACAFCAAAHATATCPIKDKPNKTPKCFNCNGPHRATYRGCPKAPKPYAPRRKTKHPSPPPLPMPPSQPSSPHPRHPTLPPRNSFSSVPQSQSPLPSQTPRPPPRRNRPQAASSYAQAITSPNAHYPRAYTPPPPLMQHPQSPPSSLPPADPISPALMDLFRAFIAEIRR